jgi:hypothetical protein
MWQVVEKRNIFFSWMLWHYSCAIKDIYSGWKDLLLFNLHYFSIPFLFRTLFSPWRRYKFSFGRGFNISKIAEVIVFNAFSRLVGAFLRIIVICFGIITETFIFLMGIFTFFCWLILPAITIWGIILSLQWIILN